MPFFGGSRASSEIHDRVKERLQTEFGHSEDDAAAIKSLLWDMAKDAAETYKKEKNKEMTGVEKAKLMEKHLTDAFIKKNITKKMIDDRKKKIEDLRAKRQNAAPQAAGSRRSRSKRVSKKTSRRRRVSKKK